MGGHIIRPLIVMQVIRIVFGHRLVEVSLEIFSYRRIGVLVDGKRRRGMLDEYITDAGFPVIDRTEACLDLRSDQVESPRVWPKCKLLLVYFHVASYEN